MDGQNEWSKMGDKMTSEKCFLTGYDFDEISTRYGPNYIIKFGEWKSKEAYPIRMHLWINNRVHGRSPVGIGPDLPESIPLRKEINLQRFNFK